MAKKKFLDGRTSVLVVLEQAQLEKLDRVAGRGGRSAYIRWLIENIDEHHITKELQLEKECAILRKEPVLLQREIEKLKKEKEKLKERIRILRAHGGCENIGEVPGVEKVEQAYQKWRATWVQFRGTEPDTLQELRFLELHAKELGVSKHSLLAHVKRSKRTLEGWVKNGENQAGE